MKIKGQVKLEIYDKNGNLRDETEWMENQITEVGVAAVAGLMGDVDTQTAFTYLAVGSDDTATSDEQTALLGEITDQGLARTVATTVARTTTNFTNDTLEFRHIWVADIESGSVSIKEIGVFNAATDGIMLSRRVITNRTIINDERLRAVYKIIIEI